MNLYMISVQVIRRIDTRIPTPLLSTFMTSTTPGLGKLADFRAVKASRSSSPSWRPTAAVPPVSTATTTTKSWNTTTTQSQGSSSNVPIQRGWTSVVTSGASTSSSAANNTITTHSSSSSVLAPTKPSSSEVLVVGSSLSRTVSPAHLPSEPVPEDWEDDVTDM